MPDLILQDVAFSFEKATKQTYRYKEQVDGMERAKIGTLYLNQALFPSGRPENTIIVSIVVPQAKKKKKK